jgi:hypothetical protein
VINFSGEAVAVATALAGTGTETEMLRPSWNVDGRDGEVGVRANSSLSFRLIVLDALCGGGVAVLSEPMVSDLTLPSR